MTDQNTPNEDSQSEGLAEFMKAAVANGMVSMGGPSDQTATKVAILQALAVLGGSLVQEDALTFEGTKFILPEMYQGRIPEAVEFLAGYQLQQESKTDMTRTFPYRPYDVAHAVQSALRTVFGTTGSGVSIQTMFGPIPPEFKTVTTGIDQTTQVPWNRVDFPPLDGYLDIDATRNSHGVVGRVTVNAARKHRSRIEGFFTAVEMELKNNSIYKGKAVINGAWDSIQFLDLSKVKRENVVYGNQVMTDLEANLWVPIRHADALRAMGRPVKRSVLLEGPFGTGKSLAGFLTAQECVANGWTFIFVKPGDDLNEAMQTAKLYAPAVVFFEDIDVLQSDDPDAVSKLLDSFDGISGKGQEIIAVLTTNYKEKIHKGMLRPGRLDAMISIGELDREGVERLIKAAVPGDFLDENVDYAEVFLACLGYLPAFISEVATRALNYAMARTGTKPQKLVTEDFVRAADGLRPQFELMTKAHEVKKPEGLDASFKNFFERFEVLDADGDPSYHFNKIKIAG